MVRGRSQGRPRDLVCEEIGESRREKNHHAEDDDDGDDAPHNFDELLGPLVI